MPETRQRPATTGHQPIQAGGGIDPHWHDRHQIVYAGRGVLSVTTDAGTWVTPATRALWIPAGTVHQHRAYGRTTLHTIGLTQNPLDLSTPTALVVSPLLRELILAYTSDAEAHRPTARGEAGAGRRRSARGSEAGRAEAGGADVVGDDVGGDGVGGDGVGGDGADRPEGGPGLVGRGSASDELAERTRLLAVLLDQLRVSAQRPAYLPSARDPRLVAVCGLLRQEPADARTLVELGRVVGASERTLSRLFRSELGMTFPQWRTQLRLHAALIELAEGESVTRVAHACGWASTSAFIDTFKQAFGHTPGARNA